MGRSPLYGMGPTILADLGRIFFAPAQLEAYCRGGVYPAADTGSGAPRCPVFGLVQQYVQFAAKTRRGRLLVRHVAIRHSGHHTCRAIADRILCATGVHHSLAGLRSEEHTSELQSLMRLSYAVFSLKQKNQ